MKTLMVVLGLVLTSVVPAGAVPVSETLGAVIVVILPDGGHSPHTERATADEVTRVARQFLEERRATPR